MKTITLSDSSYEELKRIFENEDKKIKDDFDLPVLKSEFESQRLSINKALKGNEKATKSIRLMKEQGHEPMICFMDDEEFLVCSCSLETPPQRQIDYKEAAEAAKLMGIDLMTEVQYRSIQEIREMDWIGWSWLETPKDILSCGALGGYRFGGGVRVIQLDASIRAGYGSWRGSLRVKWK